MSISRKELLNMQIPSISVSGVIIQEITLSPATIGGLHVHPCPVFGYILKGTAVLQIKDKEEQVLTERSCFYEPKDHLIAQFGNFSKKEILIFIAIYMRQGSEDLIRMLE